MYVKTSNGHGTLVRPVRNHDGRRYATVRTASGAWVSGPIIRVWRDESAARRDRFSPEQRQGR